VPGKHITVWVVPALTGWLDLMTLKRIVVLPVLELLPDPTANFKAEVRRHGHIARVEQAVYVAPKQEAIGRLMFSSISVWFDMGGFQRRQCPFTRHCAAAPIDIGDEDTKAALSQTRTDQLGLTVSLHFRSLSSS